MAGTPSRPSELMPEAAASRITPRRASGRPTGRWRVGRVLWPGDGRASRPGRRWRVAGSGDGGAASRSVLRWRARTYQFFQASTNCFCIPIFNVPTGSACHAIIFVRVRMSPWNYKGAAFMEKPTLRTKVWLWKWRAQALYCSASALMFVAIFRYHLLCFKYIGWLWLVIFFLQVQKHLSAVRLALFTHHRRLPEATNQLPLDEDRW